MSSLPGNKDGTKLKESDLRQEAYKQYCAHIASGWPKRSFCLDHPTASVTWETMDKYIRDNPTEFDSNLLTKARAKRYQHWLEEGRTLMQGKYRHGSPVVWQTIMRNIFKKEGWDRQEYVESSELKSVSDNQQKILNQLAEHQQRIKEDQLL